MNLYFYISKKIRSNNNGTFAARASRIATIVVGLGIAILIIAFAVLDGFKSSIRSKIFSLAGHIQITQADKNYSIEENPVNKYSNIYLYKDSVAEIENVQPYWHKSALLKTKEEVYGVMIKGIGDDYKTDILKEKLVKGRIIDLSTTANIAEVIISQKIAKSLKVSVGDSVIAFFVQNPPRYRRIHIVGIYETGLEEFDETMLIGNIKLVQTLNNTNDSIVGGFEILLKDMNQMYELPDTFFEYIDYDLTIETVYDKYPQIFDWLNLLDRNVLVFLIIILLVASFNMVSTVFIMIMENIKTIGLLKALGASNRQIKKIFFLNGFSVVLKGMIWGNLIGLIMCVLQREFAFIKLDPDTYYMDAVPILIDIETIFFINLLTVSIIGIVLVIPIWVVSYLQPVKSIKFN